MTSQEKKQLAITACKVRMGIIESTQLQSVVTPAAVCPLLICLPTCILRN